MSGTIGSNILSHSGIIAESAAGLSWSDTIVTGSTVTVEAGKGYWINTTSNACTITLPSSAEAGDQIVISDYARTWGTNKITLDSNGLNFQGQDDTYTVEYTTDGQSVNLIYSDSTKGWLPLEDDVTADEPVQPPTQKAIFTFGNPSATNLVNSSGVIASDVTQVGTNRNSCAGASYGGDKAIMYGGAAVSGGTVLGITNLINNSGTVGADVSQVSGVRASADVAGSSYGFDKAIVYGGYGDTDADEQYNLITNVGVVGADATGAPTGRAGTAGSKFGSSGQAIFAYGTANINISFIVTNQGVPGSDVTGVGTARKYLGCASFGGDRCVFAYGSNDNTLAVSNKVSNTGVVASDTGAVGTVRQAVAASGYGGDKGIFGFGKLANGSAVGMSNLVNSSGVVASDTTAVGTACQYKTAAGYSFTA